MILAPGFGPLTGKSAGNGNKHMSKHRQPQTAKAEPRAPRHQMAVCRQGARQSASKSPSNDLVLMPAQATVCVIADDFSPS